MNTIETLNEISRCNDNCSDYKIHQLTGFSRQYVSDWRTGKQTMSEEARKRIAKLLNQDEGLHLFYRQLELAERAKCKEEITYWKHAIKKLGKVAASIILGLSVFLSTNDSYAFSGPQADNNQANNIYYAHILIWFLLSFFVFLNLK